VQFSGRLIENNGDNRFKDRRVIRTLFALFALILGLSLSASPINAQVAALATGSSDSGETAVDLPDPLTPDAVREMVARMSDDQVRGMLLDRLDAVAAAEAAPGAASNSIADTIGTLWTAFYTPTLQALQRLPILFSKQIEAFQTFGAKFGAAGLITMFGFTALALAAGLLAEQISNRVTKRFLGQEITHDDSSLWSSLSYLFRRFWREILGLVIFYIVTRIVGRTLLDPEELAVVAPLVANLILFPRIAASFSRFVLAPQRADLRLVNVDDHWAKYLHRNMIGLVLLSGFTVFIVNFNNQNGLSLGDTRLGFWLSSAVNIYIAVIAWKAWDGLVDMMRGTDPDRTKYDEWAANFYPLFAIIVAIAMWAVVNVLAGLGKFALLQGGPHYTTMFWLLMAPLFDTAIRGLVRHLQPPIIGGGPIAEAAYRSTKRSYIRIGRVIAVGIVVLIIANAWNFSLTNFAAVGVGQRFAGNLIEFIMVLAIGYVIYELVSLWINRRLAKEQTNTAQSDEEMGGGEGGGAGSTRLATVLPLVRVTAQVAIGVIFALLALGALGVDTTPLLAGAGILGLAIGFGAQKLVSDVVSGVFFLIDDAFRVGEYVEVEGTMGTVEKISIRSMQLRHHRGLVHTIPYGEIPKLTNFSRDWVIMKLMFTVPFDTDPNKVKKIFKKIGAEMLADPLFHDDFLEPFKSQGVLQFDDVGIVMRGKFMAKPGTQFTIRKEIYNRVRNEFAANGIEFARREVRVAMPGMDHHEELTDEQKGMATAAASGVVQAQLAQEAADKPK